MFDVRRDYYDNILPIYLTLYNQSKMILVRFDESRILFLKQLSFGNTRRYYNITYTQPTNICEMVLDIVVDEYRKTKEDFDTIVYVPDRLTALAVTKNLW